MKTIRSDHHQNGSSELNEVNLSCFDDNQYLRKDGIKSWAYGHKKIKICILYSIY